MNRFKLKNKYVQANLKKIPHLFQTIKRQLKHENLYNSYYFDLKALLSE